MFGRHSLRKILLLPWEPIQRPQLTNNSSTNFLREAEKARPRPEGHHYSKQQYSMYQTVHCHKLVTNHKTAFPSLFSVCSQAFVLYFSDRASSYNSGRWPNWPTVSSMILLFESSTCFEQVCAHPQEDNCMNTTTGIVNLYYWPSGMQVKMVHLDLHTGRQLTHSDYTRSCIYTIVLLRMST